MQAIIYTRLSKQETTHKQTGLETQAIDARLFAESNGYTVVGVVSEVASGAYGTNVRLVLGAALERCKREGLTLIVSKLDRLSRDVAFISNLTAEGVSFKVAALGIKADSFTINIYSSLAQQERQLISDRTKRALKQLKDNGKALGTFAASMPQEARQRAAQSNRDNATAYASNVLPVIQSLHRDGKSHSTIAAELNKMKVKTMRGGEFSRHTVLRLLASNSI